MSSGKNLNCAVPSCSNNLLPPSEVGKCFPFPDYNALTSFDVNGKHVYYSKRKLWIDNLGLIDNRLAKDAVVCSLHFKEDDLIVSEDGATSLRDHVIPRPILKNQRQLSEKYIGDSYSNQLCQKIGLNFALLSQALNENVVQTVVKSDDDVEIIEPHRETITLDDDEEESGEDTSSASNSDSDESSSENSSPELNFETVTSKEKQEKESTRTCSSSNGTTKSKEDLTKNQSNSSKPEVNSLLERLLNKGQEPATPKSKNLNLNLKCVSLDGNKVFVHIPKPGSSSSPNPVANKPANTPGTPKTSTPKEKPNTEVKDSRGQIISTIPASDSIKQQLSLLLNKKDVKLPLLTSPAPGVKMIRVLNLPKNTFLANKLSPQNNSSQAPAKDVTTPSKNKMVRIGDGFEVYYPRKKALPSPQPNKEPSPKKKTQSNRSRASKDKNESFEVLNVKREALEKARTTREIGTQTDEHPVGFVEMYKFVKNHMIDFTLDAFGQCYMLRECTLNFESPSLGRKWDKKVACISQSTLSSTDSLLLGAMHISIGCESNNKSPQFAGYTKEILEKTERISKQPEGKKTEQANSTPTKTTEKPECPPKKNDDELLPNLVKLSKNKNIKIDKRSLLNEDDLVRPKKKLIKKKKSLLKTSMGNSRRASRVPVSQMNPSVSGRLNVDRNRFKKNKKIVLDTEKKKRLLERLDNEKPIEDDIKASTFEENDLLRENVTEGDSEEDLSRIKTRRNNRGKKKDYRRLSKKGTTEDVKRVPTKRKKPTTKGVKEKRAKYSDKVGAIESFLEVVLEPDNNEFNHNINDTEKEDNDDFYMKEDPLSLTDMRSLH